MSQVSRMSFRIGTESFITLRMSLVSYELKGS